MRSLGQRSGNAGTNYEGSALVAVRALLGIKPIGCDAEHIVALDADAVDDGTNDGAGLGRFAEASRRRRGGFLRDVFSRHGRILTRRGAGSKASLRHPREEAAHPLKAGNAWFGKQAKQEHGAQPL